jgi:hypothetical protein
MKKGSTEEGQGRKPDFLVLIQYGYSQITSRLHHGRNRFHGRIFSSRANPIKAPPSNTKQKKTDLKKMDLDILS